MLAVLVGALLKFYDDFVDDEQILTNEYLISILRTLQIGLTSLVLASDFWTCLLFMAFNLACILSSYHEYMGPHVFSVLFLTPFLIISSWPHKSSFGSKLDIAALSVILGSGLVEPKLFPEEASVLKLCFRFIGFILATSILWWFQLSIPIHTFFSMFAGYCLASVFGQLVKLGFIPKTLKETYSENWSEQHTQPQEPPHQSS